MTSRRSAVRTLALRAISVVSGPDTGPNPTAIGCGTLFGGFGEGFAEGGVPRRGHIHLRGTRSADVAISLAAHVDNLDLEVLFTARDSVVGNADLAEVFRYWKPAPTDPVERFWRWVDEPNTGELEHDSLAWLMHHLASFWEARERPNVVLVHYADLQRVSKARCVASNPGSTSTSTTAAWPHLAVVAGFDTMRERADELAPNASEGILQSNRAFFRSGRTGQWQLSTTTGAVDTPRESNSSHRPTSSSGHTTNHRQPLDPIPVRRCP